MENIRVGFIGLGKMGSALAYGIERSKLIGNQNIYYHTPVKKEAPFVYLQSSCQDVRYNCASRETRPCWKSTAGNSEGSLVFCANNNVDATDKQKVINIFSGCGVIQEIKEADMDIATAISGCGPAYVFLFIESLIDAGVKNGLNRDVSKKLVLQTILGSVHMVNASSHPVQQLKDDVCSPGGITIVGLSTLEKHAFKYAEMNLNICSSDLG
ncbi:pyrroline carboxylate reductase [Plasmodium cynomolgi strain B]|uniref:Pyrroline carboxylate reductase n=1 Tax=Plasmodium cynomolgi (strain B) TaxID=1120755 RepID=K6UDU4_PLACD|nr:pyrroline carboxylate reductase [Plasmodium cynomolgi strain B]GAB67206.1 pyrroline carboxylate reductase [Plasmodium cynomolgi strain B]